MSTAGERFLRNLDWNLLYTFNTIVEEGSITGAARKLSLSQPSVSNSLKRFESSLGVTLIIRRKGEFSLTYEGRRVYEQLSSANSIISDLVDNFTHTEETLQGKLEIQIASHISFPPFDRALRKFNELYSNVLISLNTHPSAEIINSVSSSCLNIGISNKKVSQPELRIDELGNEPLGFYCGPSHDLFGRQDLKIEDISSYPYVSFESDQPGEGLSVIAEFRSDKKIWGRLAAISSNEEEVRRLIMSGVGFGSLSIQAAKLYVENNLLWQLPPYEDLPLVKIYLVTPEKTRLSDIEKRFISILRKESNNHILHSYFNSNG